MSPNTRAAVGENLFLIVVTPETALSRKARSPGKRMALIRDLVTNSEILNSRHY